MFLKTSFFTRKEPSPLSEAQVDRELINLWRQRCDRQTHAPPWEEEELRSILAKSLPEKEECVRQLEQERYIDDRLLQYWRAPALVRRKDRWELDKLLAQPLEEKKRYLRRQGWKAAGILVVLAGVGLFFYYHGPSSPAPPVPAPVWHSAGKIESLELHHSFLSTVTTVITTTGIYQVTGGVSAARGETAQLKQETLPFGNTKTSLCVHSSLQSTCYELY